MTETRNPLASRAMLATLNTGAWGATRLHRDETLAENTRHGIDAAKVSIRLTDHPALSEIGKLHAAARQEHYRLTLPSGEDGWRFMPCGREMEHAAAMQDFRVKHETLAARFVADYTTERETAPKRLNGLYRPEFFPLETVVASRFKFAVRYLPVPEQGTWQEWLMEAAVEAEGNLRERLRAALQKMAGKLGDADATFRDTLVTNLAEVVALVPDLNLTGAIDIAHAAALADALSKLNPDILRENKAIRTETAKAAQNILTALGGKL